MPDKPKHILVIRLSAMGDVAMTVPVILTFVKQYPDVKLSILTKPFLAKLFKQIPEVNTIIAKVDAEHKGFSGLRQLSIELKKHQFTHVADLHDVLRTKVLKFFLFFQGTKIKSIDKGRKEKRALTSTKSKIFKSLKHSTERYADVFRALGFDVNLKQPVLCHKEKLKTDFISDFNFPEVKRHLGIAPFAAHDTKVYPSDFMQECIKVLSKDKTLNIYLFGSKGQEMSRLQNWAHPYNNVFCVAGRYDFESELNLISHLNLMLSMDSANGHLAAMYGVKTITLWGQTHPYAGFTPFGQPENHQITPDRDIFPLIPTSVYGHISVEGYQNIMRSIKPETVINKVKALLY
jgi:ADP-heptose:LPS heptosyltransferase